MKSNSNTRPGTLEYVGNGKWHYNYNITERTIEEEGAERTTYDYDYVAVSERPSYPVLVDARVRDIMSSEEEFSLINKYNDFNAGLSTDTADRDNYLAYRRQVIAIKTEVRQLFD